MSTDNITPIRQSGPRRHRGFNDEQVIALQQAIAIIQVIQTGALGGAITTETSLPENALQRSRSNCSTCWTRTRRMTKTQGSKRSPIRCKACGWEGLGRECQVGEVFEGGQISEYHCPKCGEYLRAVPWPMLGEPQD